MSSFNETDEPRGLLLVAVAIDHLVLVAVEPRLVPGRVLLLFVRRLGHGSFVGLHERQIERMQHVFDIACFEPGVDPRDDLVQQSVGA